MIIERTLSLAMCDRLPVFLKRGHERRLVKVEPQLQYIATKDSGGVNWHQPEPTRQIGYALDGKGDEMEFSKPVGAKS